ncbi:MAG: hypothetical protein VW892_00845, partial [Flavobacteriaceae bacterium]
FFNAAKALASKIMDENSLNDDKERMQYMFRTITLRKPNQEEKQLLENYFTQLVENPETSKENPYVDLALLIYNLDETTQKS